MRAGPHEAVGTEASLAKEGGEHGVVAEAVDVVADGRFDAKVLSKPALAEAAVGAEGVGCRKVAVGLDPPAVDDGPASGPDVAFDALKKRGVGGLDLLVDPGFAAGDDEVGVLVQ